MRFLFVCLLLICLFHVIHAYLGRRHFTKSKFFSLHATQHLPQYPLDLGDPKNILTALDARVFKKELILFVFDAPYPLTQSDSKTKSNLGDAVNMIVQLNAIGFAHYIALAPSPQACERLHDAWQPRYGSRPSCAWSSFPAAKTGSVPRILSLNALWAMRYFIVTTFAEHGINVFMHDLDVTYHSDPYIHFKSPQFQNSHFIALPEGPVNGGMIYIQNVHPAGGILWVLRQPERRYTTIEAIENMNKKIETPGQLGDQWVLSDALRVATTNSSTWDWWANVDRGDTNHSFWKKFPQKKPDRLFNWDRAFVDSYAYTCPSTDKAVCWRFDQWKITQKNTISSSTIHVPYDELIQGPAEELITAPPWLFGFGGIAQNGWTSVMTHHLGIETSWTIPLRGSHTGRHLVMSAAGYISPPWALRAEQTALLLKLDTRNLQYESFESFVDILRTFVITAVGGGRLPVMPEIPCSTSWIKKSNSTASGIGDHRILVSGSPTHPLCYPSDMGWNSCWPWSEIVYDFDPLLQNRSTIEMVRVPVAWKNYSKGVKEDIVLQHLSMLPTIDDEDRERINKFIKKCFGTISPISTSRESFMFQAAAES